MTFLGHDPRRLASAVGLRLMRWLCAAAPALLALLAALLALLAGLLAHEPAAPAATCTQVRAGRHAHGRGRGMDSMESGTPRYKRPALKHTNYQPPKHRRPGLMPPSPRSGSHAPDRALYPG